MEHMAHLYTVGLESRDMLRLLTLTQEYRVPETLKVCLLSIFHGLA